jgi:hypothetical protein
MAAPEVLLRPDPEGLGDFIILEFQGRVTTSGSEAGLAGHEIGALTIDGTAATLMIGMHVLSGKVETFKTPMLFLRKPSPSNVGRPSGSGIPDDNDMDAPKSSIAGAVTIVGTVRRRIVFKDRPRIVINADKASEP